MAEPLNITCGAACTVTVQLEPAPASDERIADMTELFYLMMMVVIAVWGGRKLYDFFNRGPND
jgi:flagellar biogenesis protein FliO